MLEQSIPGWEDLSQSLVTQVQIGYQKLLQQNPRTKRDWQHWLQEYDLLRKGVMERKNQLSLNVDCQSNNEVFQKDYFHFIIQEEPQFKKKFNQLDQKFKEDGGKRALREPFYQRHHQLLDRDLQLFHEVNVGLQKQEQSLILQYRKIISNIQINFQGTQYTLMKMKCFYQSSDRNVREPAWRAEVKGRDEYIDALNQLFVQLLENRNQQATNLGFENYQDYSFKKLDRFDYTVGDCLEFHQSIQDVIVPLVSELYSYRQKKLDLSQLCPWDLEVDVESTQSLIPFESLDALLLGVIEICNRMHPDFGQVLQQIQSKNLLDIEPRPGKSAGGYTYLLPKSGIPFIMMSAMGRHRDLAILLHEAGHAIHYYLSRNIGLVRYQVCPLEFSETVAMSMELMSMQYWTIFYKDPEDLRRAQIMQLNQGLSLFLWIATIDAFQHWLYLNLNHSHIERENKWQEIFKRFFPFMKMSEFCSQQSWQWQSQLHLFAFPFYYIEYAIAQLGAYQAWDHYRKDSDYIKQFNAALQLGHSVTIPELFQNAGLKFDFSSEFMNSVITKVRNEIEQLTIL